MRDLMASGEDYRNVAAYGAGAINHCSIRYSSLSQSFRYPPMAVRLANGAATCLQFVSITSLKWRVALP